MKKYVLFVTVFCLLIQGIIEGVARTGENGIGFAEAWQKVVVENDALTAARENVRQAEFKRDAARDMYLPEIGISAGYMHLDDKVTLSPEDILESMSGGNRLAPLLVGLGQSYGLSASTLNSALTSTIADRDNRSGAIEAFWPIYTGGRINAAQDIAKGQESEAQRKLDMTRLERFETLAYYYFGALLAKQVLATRNEVEQGLQQHRDHAVILENQGQIAKVERLQAEAAYEKALVEKRKAAHDLDISRVALTRMLKSSEVIIPTDRLFINSSLPPLESFIDKTLAASPGLGILKSKQQQAAGLIKVEKGKYFPTVAVFGNYSLYEEDNLLNKLVPDWVVGIGINIPLVERSGRGGNLEAAKSMVRQLESLQIQARIHRVWAHVLDHTGNSYGGVAGRLCQWI